MQTRDFLARILPSRGRYCIGHLSSFTDKNGVVKPFVKHRFVDDLDLAAATALDWDAQGLTVYHACASFNGANKRTREDAKWVRAFWMDLDVGEGPNKFATIDGAIEALSEFVKEARLPSPLVVLSGGGLHCYWTLIEDISPGQWETAAKLLKSLCIALEFKADPMRTADIASVLRPVGTHNRKHGEAVVRLGLDAGPYNYVEFYNVVETACKQHKAKKPYSAPKEPINAKFQVPLEYPPSSAHKIAEKCAQIRAVRDTGGDVSEPVWYAAIQLLHFTIESDELIHSWSSPYPGYSAEETDKKINQIREMAPTTCAKFEQVHAAGCTGCPHRGKITSAIQLGLEIKVKEAPQTTIEEKTVTLPNPPAPFQRTEHGLFVEDDNGVLRKFYDYDVYPLGVYHDEQLGYETMKLRHFLPKDGWLECSIRTALIERPQELAMALRGNHIHPDNSKLMAVYMHSYLKSLQHEFALKRVFHTMGWKPDGSFACGELLYKPNGEVVKVDAPGGSGMAEIVCAKGSLDKWVELTRALGEPGMEAHLFSLCLGFGAPLLALLGLQGVTVSLLGISNSGKSSMARWLLSIYGDGAKMFIQPNSSIVAMTERLGTYGNLPVYVDESTNLDLKKMSDICYWVSTGFDKRRLRQDGTPRPQAQWSTFMILSTNTSLMGKLTVAKGHSEAEALRLFEYYVQKIPNFETFCKETLHVSLSENYGLAAERYLPYIVQNQDWIKETLYKLRNALDTQTHAEGSERYWSAVAACTLLGARFAKELGLLACETTGLVPWLEREVGRMRSDLGDSKPEALDVLAHYLNEFAQNRLVVDVREIAGRTIVDVVRHPVGPIYARLEVNLKAMYIDWKHFKRIMVEHHHDPNQIKRTLKERRILTNDSAKKCLGAFTIYESMQIMCWKLDLRHPDVESYLHEGKL